MPTNCAALRARLTGNVLDGIQSVILTRDECTALLAVYDAAVECWTPCAVDRSWCTAHQQRTPCPFATLRAACEREE